MMGMRRRDGAPEQSQGLECDIAPVAEAEWVRHTHTVEVEGMFGRLRWRVCKPAPQSASYLAVRPPCLAYHAGGKSVVYLRAGTGTGIGNSIR